MSGTDIIGLIGLFIAGITLSPLLPRIRIDLDFFLDKTEKELMLSKALVYAKVSNTGYFKLRGQLSTVIESDVIDSFIEVIEYPDFCLKFDKHLSREINLRGSEMASLRICEAFGQGHLAVLHEGRDWSRLSVTNSDIKTFTVFFQPGFMIGKRLRLLPIIKIKKEFNFIDDLAIPTNSKILESGANPAWIRSRFRENRRILSQIILNGETDEDKKARELKNLAFISLSQKKSEVIEMLSQTGASTEEQAKALKEIGIETRIGYTDAGPALIAISNDDANRPRPSPPKTFSATRSE